MPSSIAPCCPHLGPLPLRLPRASPSPHPLPSAHSPPLAGAHPALTTRDKGLPTHSHIHTLHIVLAQLQDQLGPPQPWPHPTTCLVSGLSIFLLRLILPPPPPFFLFLFLSPSFLPFNSIFLFLLFPTNFPMFSFSPSFSPFFSRSFLQFYLLLLFIFLLPYFPSSFGAAPCRTSLVFDAPTFPALSPGAGGGGAWLGGRHRPPGHTGQDLEQETGEWGCLTDSYREPQGHRMGHLGTMVRCVWRAVKCIFGLY